MIQPIAIFCTFVCDKSINNMKKILLSLLLFLASEFAFAQYDSLEADSVAGELDYTASICGGRFWN